MRDVRMIVHVIAREIGKTAGGDAHAVEPELVEPVRGRLEGQMRDAVAGDFVELPVKRDRVRRRQRAVDRALRRNQTDGADAGGSVAEPFPDLARERGDRRLAAGAGHRRCCRGLARIKSRRRQRQRAARIWRDDEGHAEARRRMVTGHRDRARLIAESTKREPSVLLPAAAKNRSPGFAARLSTQGLSHRQLPPADRSQRHR
jgi:hypothetical protein